MNLLSASNLISILFSVIFTSETNMDINSLIRIRLKAVHFENQPMINHKITQKYETTDEESQHLTKLMEKHAKKTNLDLTFTYEKFSRSNFNPQMMFKKICEEFRTRRRINPITNTLFLINDDNDDVDRRNSDMGLEYMLYLYSIMKIPIITWFPDRAGQLENSFHSMAIRLEPMNWHIAHAFVDFMQAYNWDLVTLLVSNRQREYKIFLKELQKIQKERNDIEHVNYFPFTISDIHYFQGLDTSEMHSCITMGQNCLTVRSLMISIEKIHKNNDRIILFIGNKYELVVMISSLRKYAVGPRRRLLQLFGKGYLWICSPSFMSPVETSKRSDSILLDSMAVQNWINKEGMKVSGMFFLGCLNHHSIYKEKAKIVRKLWQKSILNLTQYFEEQFPLNKTDLIRRIVPQNICTQQETVWKWGQKLFQIMKSETIEYNGEYIGFNNDGIVNTTELLIFNSKVVQNRMKWFKVGKWSMSSKWGKNKSKIRIDGVTWPGGENKPPKGRPDKVKLRVVTIEERPFVFFTRREENGKCGENSILCRVLKRQGDDNEDFLNSEDGVRSEIMSLSNTSSKPVYIESCCGGLTMDLLKELMKDLNFVVDLFEVPDGKWGGWTPQGWNGLVKVLLDGEADLAMTSLKITPNRSEQIDFSVPFMETGIAIIVALRRGAISPTAFLEPYDYPSWCLILVFSVHACGAALFIYEWLSPHGLDRGNGLITDHKFSLVRSLWLIWSMLFGAAVNTDNPRGVASRFLANIWALFGLVFLASYTANLAAFMIAKDDYYDLEGIKDLRLKYPRNHKPIFRFATVPSGATEETVKINFPEMYAYMQNYNKTTVDEGIRSLKNGEIDAFIYDSNVLDYKAAKDKMCKLKTVGNLFAMTGYGVGFPKGSKWRQKINDLILQYQKYGKLQRAKSFWMTGQCKKERSLDTTNKRLGVTNFISAFILLLVGMIICSFILLLEHAFYRYFRSKIKKMDHYGCCQLVSISMGQIISFEQSIKETVKKEAKFICTNQFCHINVENLKNENELLKQQNLKLETALSYLSKCDELKKQVQTQNTISIAESKLKNELPVPLSKCVNAPNKKHQEEINREDNIANLDHPIYTYRCENQRDISAYCPKHIELFNQKHSRHHSFYTIPKLSHLPVISHPQSVHNDSILKKFPSCNNVAALSQITKPNDSPDQYKIIKSKSPNNFYTQISGIYGPRSTFKSSILKGKKNKDELLMKESCL